MEASSLELYFIDAAGTRWCVHDVRFMGGKAHPAPLRDPHANTRHFVAADGERRAFTFEKTSSRSLTLDAIAEHFRGAGYVGRLPPFDARERDAR